MSPKLTIILRSDHMYTVSSTFLSCHNFSLWRVQGLRIAVSWLRYRFEGLGSLGFEFRALGLRVQCLGFRVFRF